MSQTPSERTAYWQQHIDDWQASGLSGTAYCQQYHLTYHCFVYWRGKFARAATRQDSEVNQPGKTLSAFVAIQPPVLPAAGTPAEEAGSLQLALPNGLVIRNIRNTNLCTIRSLLEQL